MCGGYDAGFKRFAGGLMGRGLGLMLGFEYVVPEEDRRSLRIRIEFRKVSNLQEGSAWFKIRSSRRNSDVLTSRPFLTAPDRLYYYTSSSSSPNHMILCLSPTQAHPSPSRTPSYKRNSKPKPTDRSIRMISAWWTMRLMSGYTRGLGK